MKKDDTYRSQFRLPWSLYESLKEEAEKNHRSLNAEMVDRLQASFDSESRQGDWIGNLSMSDVEAIVTRLKDELSK